MQSDIDNTARRLGELDSMASQTDKMEARFITLAEKRLAVIENAMQDARQNAYGSEEGEDIYLTLIKERGILLQVISQARSHVAPS